MDGKAAFSRCATCRHWGSGKMPDTRLGSKSQKKACALYEPRVHADKAPAYIETDGDIPAFWTEPHFFCSRWESNDR